MKIRLNQLIYVFADAVVSAFAIFFAVWLRFDGLIPGAYQEQLLVYIPVAILSVLLFSVLFGAYSSIWAYIGFAEVFRQGFVTGASAALFLIIKYTGLYPVSGSITVIYMGILFVLTAAARSILRFKRWFDTHIRGRANGSGRRVLIVGAGAAGAALINRLRDSWRDGLCPVAAVDDDKSKQGMQIVGIPVAGTIDEVARVAAENLADEIIIAVPSASADELATIYERCRETGLPVRLFQTVVDIDNFFSGDHHALREMSLEDLLFRDSIRPNMAPAAAFLSGKTVLVTGGAGSIGSEICRQVLEHGAGKVIVFDIHENGLFEIGEELGNLYGSNRFVLCLGSIRDRVRLDGVFTEHAPHIVLHAAAHKHVPMMENNAGEAVKNNVFGTKNVLACCASHGVLKCILISSDKAVHPTSVMGATKRISELLMLSMRNTNCEMAAVRFGNVLGSAGSVVPTFRRQIEEGGPVTVTHPEMKRYFMTISEAVSLVLLAGVQAKGGEIFVLDMGKPVKIYNLARTMIHLSGLTPGKDIQIEITGLRPGEKLFEELVLDSESVDRTETRKIYVLREKTANLESLARQLQQLQALCSGGNEEALCELTLEMASEAGARGFYDDESSLAEYAAAVR